MLKVVPRSPLFAGIADEEIPQMLKCLRARQAQFRKGEFIMRAYEPIEHIGIVLSGGANVIREDWWGGRGMMAHIEPGNLFAEAVAMAGIDRLPVRNCS